MTLVKIQKRIAQLVTAKKDATGLPWRDIAKEVYAENSANKIFRITHPFDRNRAGKLYAADWKVSDVVGALEWCGLTLGDLDPPAERRDAAALFVFIDEMDGPEEQRLVLRSIVQAFCAQTGFGVNVDFTDQQEVA